MERLVLGLGGRVGPRAASRRANRRDVRRGTKRCREAGLRSRRRESGAQRREVGRESRAGQLADQVHSPGLVFAVESNVLPTI